MAAVPDQLERRAREWIVGDPDPATRAELRTLLDAGDVGALTERLGGTLAFGTAGLRGLVGAGPTRMNRAVVIRATRGLADHVLAAVDPDAARPVVVGFDARTDSDRFARDVVGVLAAAGLPVRWFPQPVPTPVAAYAARVLGASAAVVVTASHNPREWNGYKIYGDNAAQIVPPVDVAIAAAIDAVGPAVAVPRVVDPTSSPGVTTVEPGLLDRYLADIEVPRRRANRPVAGLDIVYTPLHGVGGRVAFQALGDAGHRVHVVASQFVPDPTFPTVAFPNPEEPGALDLAVRLADDVDAQLVIANDPDADRLAVAIPVRVRAPEVRRRRLGRGPPPAAGAGWRTLTGNEVGVLLGAHVLERTSAERPLTVSSIVSSPMLAAVAAVHGARHEVTLTGFKWICKAALDLERDEGLDFVFGYEEALGYTVGAAVRDKDGIGAAVAFADLAGGLAAEGRTVDDRLEQLYRSHGLWVSRGVSATRTGREGVAEIDAAMTGLGDGPGQTTPSVLGPYPVTGVTDYRVGAQSRPRWLPAHPLVALALAGGRALVRPSGTEPKLKVYVDLRSPLAPGDDVTARRAALERDAVTVATALIRFVGLA